MEGYHPQEALMLTSGLLTQPDIHRIRLMVFGEADQDPYQPSGSRGEDVECTAGNAEGN